MQNSIRSCLAYESSHNPSYIHPLQARSWRMRDRIENHHIDITLFDLKQHQLCSVVVVKLGATITTTTTHGVLCYGTLRFVHCSNHGTGSHSWSYVLCCFVCSNVDATATQILPSRRRSMYIHVCWAHRFYRRGRRSPSTRKDFVRSATTFYKTFCRTLLIS